MQIFPAWTTSCNAASSTQTIWWLWIRRAQWAPRRTTWQTPRPSSTSRPCSGACTDTNCGEKVPSVAVCRRCSRNADARNADRGENLQRLFFCFCFFQLKFKAFMAARPFCCHYQVFIISANLPHSGCFPASASSLSSHTRPTWGSCSFEPRTATHSLSPSWRRWAFWTENSRPVFNRRRMLCL